MPRFSKRKGKAPIKRKVSPAVKTYVKKTITARKPVRTFFYEPSAGGEITTTAVVDDLTAIAVAGAGTADDPEVYRSQQQLRPLKLELSGVWSAKDTATVDNYMRMIVFIWPEERGANPPSAAEVFGDAFTYPYLAKPFSDIDTTKGTVLYDRLFQLAPHYDGASQIAGRKTIPIRKTIYLGKRPMIRYLSNAGTAGKNHIYILYVGNTASGVQTSTLQLDSQLFYQE